MPRECTLTRPDGQEMSPTTTTLPVVGSRCLLKPFGDSDRRRVRVNHGGSVKNVVKMVGGRFASPALTSAITSQKGNIKCHPY